MGRGHLGVEWCAGDVADLLWVFEQGWSRSRLANAVSRWDL